jgi:hypothetical protein
MVDDELRQVADALVAQLIDLTNRARDDRAALAMHLWAAMVAAWRGARERAREKTPARGE